ncbi:natural killer cells antigen CD94-like isoform X2 [Kryptolebias marmoratus]|uniref:natural killer cells antigen CD94-like isoform X2 n=1 Tax=Kryptolebias marmoratus TaxID=37003 RepID=UPI000D52FC08|nr:natural killer cells antigen CD94-like isoform X2 [Kryptolebias marmoratus]
MSCNIYEDPDLMMKVRYSKGARAKREDRVETVVEIYESSDASPDRRVGPIRQDGGAPTESRGQDLQRNNYRIAALILGLLCLMLLGGIGVLLNLYLMVLSKLESIFAQNKNLTEIQRSNENQTQVTDWHWFRKQCFYASTEKKNWTESRKDCQRRGADLVVINNYDKHELETRRT